MLRGKFISILHTFLHIYCAICSIWTNICSNLKRVLYLCYEGETKHYTMFAEHPGSKLCISVQILCFHSFLPLYKRLVQSAFKKGIYKAFNTRQNGFKEEFFCKMAEKQKRYKAWSLNQWMMTKHFGHCFHSRHIVV